MHYILAVDRGGTKCDALLVGDDGRAAGRGRCDYRDPGSGRGWGGSGRTEQNRSRAVREALRDWRGGDSLTLVGDCTLAPGDLPAEVHCPIRRLPASERDIGLSFLREEAGIAALIGTGALLVGRSADGRIETLDGLGPFLGDYGSAYYIGALAMKAAARADWHPRHHTSLARVVPEACAAHAGSPPDFHLVPYSLQPRDRSEIAALAALVDREARAGDAVARQLLEEAAAALGQTVWDLRERLSLTGGRLTLVGVGSVIAGSDHYWRALCDQVATYAPDLRAVRITYPAILGYVLLAAREMGWPNAERLPELLFPQATQE